MTDCGVGFLDELRRAQIRGIADDRAAIKWCLQKGTTAKGRGQEDPWRQRVPEDVEKSPFSKGVGIYDGENWHQGLGLYRMAQLIEQFQAELWIASGTALLY